MYTCQQKSEKNWDRSGVKTIQSKFRQTGDNPACSQSKTIGGRTEHLHAEYNGSLEARENRDLETTQVAARRYE